MNAADRAHIYAASDEGPRAVESIDAKQLNSLGNLLLVCQECHRKIDQDKDGHRYSDRLLLKWKRDHEDRIERVTAIHRSKKSHIILYGAPIGDMSKPLTYEAVTPALFPAWYPATDHAIVLEMRHSQWRDRDEIFWQIESENLRQQVRNKIADRFEDGSMDHVSLFGFAPQPLLILFGSLLTDIPPAQTYQLRREPQGWTWDEDQRPIELLVDRPNSTTGTPALVFSLSGTVTPDRIHRVLGEDASIWSVSVPTPDRDVINIPDHLRQFRELVRQLLDEMKAAHGHTTPLHVFPAMPISTAIDFGRIRMPKADAPWVLYDELGSVGGFTHALTIENPATVSA